MFSGWDQLELYPPRGPGVCVSDEPPPVLDLPGPGLRTYRGRKVCPGAGIPASGLAGEGAVDRQKREPYVAHSGCRASGRLLGAGHGSVCRQPGSNRGRSGSVFGGTSGSRKASVRKSQYRIFQKEQLGRDGVHGAVCYRFYPG